MSGTGAPRYLYGVVRSGSTQGGPLVRGLDGEPVAEVAAGPVAALCSPHPGGEVDATRAGLETHLRVLQEIAEHTTVAPMRFGMVAPDEDAVRDEVLAPRRREFLAVLRQLDGMVEIDVKASFREDAVIAEIVREDPSIRRLNARIRSRPGDASYYDRVRLGELVVAAMKDKGEREGRALLRRLTNAAHSARSGPLGTERMLLNAAFLVERRSLDEFDRAVARVEQEQGNRMRVRSIGPLPPSSFATLDAGGRRRSWRRR